MANQNLKFGQILTKFVDIFEINKKQNEQRQPRPHVAALQAVAAVDRVAPGAGATAAMTFNLHGKEKNGFQCLRRRKLRGAGALEEEEEARRRWSIGGGVGAAALPPSAWRALPTAASGGLWSRENEV